MQLCRLSSDSVLHFFNLSGDANFSPMGIRNSKRIWPHSLLEEATIGAYAWADLSQSLSNTNREGYLLAKKAFSPLSREGSQLPRRKHSVLLQVSYSPEFLGIGTLLLERHPQSYPQRQRPVEQGLFRAVSSRLPSPAKSWSGTGARLQLKSLRAP